MSNYKKYTKPKKDIGEQMSDYESNGIDFIPQPDSFGHKQDPAYSHSGNFLLEFFSKAGNFSPNSHSYHGEIVSSLSLFKNAWFTDQYRSMQLAMWLRDCRGGSGNRNAFRQIINWISIYDPKWIESNIRLIPEYGRWDDLIALMDTHCEKLAISFWSEKISEGDRLACKWVPRENKSSKNKKVYHKLRKKLKFSPSDFRKHLSANTEVVENLICSNEWDQIDYNHVPSVAMARLNNSFSQNDSERFKSWKDSLSDEDSKNKVNASVLFPHDCIRTLKAEHSLELYSGYSNDKYKESALANAQFKALPNYMEGNKLRIMSICDFSASMAFSVSKKSSIEMIDVCMGLGLYCSDRLGEDNPFYRMFIPFSNDARLVSWENETFSLASQKYIDGYMGSTNINSALDKILESAILLKASKEQMPNCILIISDMQWDCSIDGGYDAAVEASLKKWSSRGYSRPKIVYWNLNRYDNQPATIKHPNVALVSGYSPSILKAICQGEEFTPMGIMLKAISKYPVVKPEKANAY